MMTRRHWPDRPTEHALPAPEEWLPRYGDALYRYALSRLRRPHEAEEAVQEALLGALRSRAQFAGHSSGLTWLLGILKRKVSDRLRLAAREAPAVDWDRSEAMFDSWGKWRKVPANWNDPAEWAERAEFWQVVRRCLAKLPAGMAEAFTLRTIEDHSPGEVCRKLSISSSNLWVLLHRARLRLVRCLQINWFEAEE